MKKPPLYPHIPKSRTKASSQVEVIETGDRDWYKPGIHLRNPSAEKIEDAKEEAINKGFDTVYVHRVAETTENEVTNEMLSATNAKIHIIKAINELDLAGRMLPPGGRTGKVLDLFSGTDDRLNHIKEDLEDISEGRPFRHG